MKTAFLKNFEELCESHHESCRAVLIKTGIAKSAIANWRKGSLPNVVTLNKIAEYFNVPINVLVGMDDDGIVDYNLSPVSEDGAKLLRTFAKASDLDKKIVGLILSKYEED